MNKPTLEEAIQSYNETIKLPFSYWANWVTTVNISLQNGTWHGEDTTPAFAKEVYNHLLTDKTTSHADSN